MEINVKYLDATREKCCIEILKGKSYEDVREKYVVNNHTLRSWVKNEFSRIANDETVTIESLENEKNKKNSKQMKLCRRLSIIDKILKLKKA